jgi:hypothetical protein
MYQTMQKFDRINEQFDAMSKKFVIDATHFMGSDKRKLSELTDFYKHLSGIVENLVEKHATTEKVIENMQKGPRYSRDIDTSPMASERPLITKNAEDTSLTLPAIKLDVKQQ